MATMNITEKEPATEVKDSASFLVTQPETIDGESREALRRAGLGLVKDAIVGDVDEMPQEGSTNLITSGGVHMATAQKADNLYFDEEEKLLYLTAGGEIISDGIAVSTGGGGGGGSSNNAVLTLTNASGFIYKTVAQGAACELAFTWSSLEDGLPTGAGTLRVTVNGTLRVNREIAQGDGSVEVGGLLAQGNNTVRLSVVDGYGNTRTLNFNLTAVTLTLTSTFDATVAYTGDIPFVYTPTGTAVKTVHVLLDGVELATATVTSSGRQQTYVLPAQSHGSHALEVYFTAQIDEAAVESNHLHYALLCLEEGNTTPVIASSWQAAQVAQYATMSIPYQVYDPAGLTAEIVLSVDGSEVARLTVPRTPQVWSWRPMEAGEHTLSIACGGVLRLFQVPVAASQVDVEAETRDLALYLTSAGRSNREENPGVWGFGDIQATFTGFQWASDGWLQDADGLTALRITGDARVEIPYLLFGQDFRGTGKTVEIEFATRDVRNYDTVVLSCMQGGRGLEMTAQAARMASEQTRVETQYKEGEHVRLSLVVEKRSENRLVLIYLNGVLSGAQQYPAGDDFSQVAPVGLTLGSNDCTLDMYAIRVYDNDLTRFQILDNWIADTQNGGELVDRYEANQVFDEYGAIVLGKLPQDLPYLVLECPQLPQYKGDKKTVSGRYVDPADGSRSFTFTGAQADVQGTSSQYYARKNYKIKFRGGFVDEEGTALTGYALRPGGIPTDTFTFKADVASSEGANNVELVRLYNDACPYKTPAQEADARVRQGIDGLPIVVFWTNDGGETSFVGKYNFNHDKGTPEIFGFADGDESWEILNNTSRRVLWQSADFAGEDWLNDFEGRYPEDNVDGTRLAELAAWISATDQEAATGADLEAPVVYGEETYTQDTAAYRLAKFKAELSGHVELDSVLFYYLFTELFLMVDSRAKNAFPSTVGGDKWCFLPYDMDTALGTNNEGALVFSYELEDIDKLAGADVYNGQSSVLWVNLRQAFYEELRGMYQSLRSTGALSYPDTEGRFAAHQAKWPAAIFNEDAYFKYLAPLVEDGSGAYLSMLQGSKAEQRKWWLYNRFRYLDAKYNAGDALSDVITLRGYAKADVTVKPYADIYASVKYGSYLVQTRALRGASYTLACPLDSVNDTEIYIYSASQLAEVGDLSGLMVGYAEFSFATKLQSLKLGDGGDGYQNPNLTELVVGNNTLLQEIDVRNCPNLTQAVDLSGCVNLERVYLEGTGVTGVALPEGGQLKTLHLPGTVTSLVLQSQKALTDFSLPSYEQVTTLRLEHVSEAVDALALLNTMAAGSRVRLVGFTWEFDTGAAVLALCDTLDAMRGLDEQGGNVDKAQVAATVHVPAITGAELAQVQARYPGLTVVYEHITSYLYFYNEDGTALLYTQEVRDGGDGTDPVAAGALDEPTKQADAQYKYTFAGWDKSLDNVTADRSVYAVFDTEVQTYTVRFYNGTTLLQTVDNVPYGSSAAYDGATPVKDGVSEPTEYHFTGWEPKATAITGATDCYAQFVYNGVQLISRWQGEMPGAAYWISVAEGDGVIVAVAGYERITKNAAWSDDDGATWHWAKLPTAGDWNVVYGDGVFVAVAKNYGYTAYSTDNGKTWQEGTKLTDSDWSNLAYGGGVFVVASGATNTSTNYYVAANSKDGGKTWTEVSLQVSGKWTGLVYGGGSFLMVGYRSTNAVYSKDGGATWNSSTLPKSDYWNIVRYVNGEFLVFATNYDASAYSTDGGETWTAGVRPETSGSWYGYTYGDGVIVAVRNASTGAAYSTDGGHTWTTVTLPVSKAWTQVLYCNGVFLARADTAGVVSKDGGNLWTEVTLPSGIWTCAATKNRFLLLSRNSDSAAWSLDGDGWMDAVIPTSGVWRNVAYGGGTLVALPNVYARALYSTDKGRTWLTSSMPLSGYMNAPWISAAYGDGVFVALYNSGTSCARSTDGGKTWETITMPSSGKWKSVAYGNGAFVAICEQLSTAAAYSTDGGATWTASALPSSANWASVAYGNGFFVVTDGGTTASNASSGYSRNAAYSLDNGATWTAATMPSSAWWVSVTYGNGTFVAVDGGNKSTLVGSRKAAYSTDGVTWTAANLPTTALWVSVVYVKEDIFVAIAGGDSNAAAISTDGGRTWNPDTLPAVEDWSSITTDGDMVIAVARNGLYSVTCAVDKQVILMSEEDTEHAE